MSPEDVARVPPTKKALEWRCTSMMIQRSRDSNRALDVYCRFPRQNFVLGGGKQVATERRGVRRASSSRAKLRKVAARHCPPPCLRTTPATHLVRSSVCRLSRGLGSLPVRRHYQLVIHAVLILPVVLDALATSGMFLAGLIMVTRNRCVAQSKCMEIALQ